jgi:DnaJ-class molecular chaperone
MSNPKDAPWNKPDPVDCPRCKTTGTIPQYFCVECNHVNNHDPDHCNCCQGEDLEKIEERECDLCRGLGSVEPKELKP